MEERQQVNADIDVFIDAIEKLKEKVNYKEMDPSQKMSFKATVQLEIAELTNRAIDKVFEDTPDYEPMSLGQLSIDMLTTIFPLTENLMNFLWVPWILSPKTADAYDVNLTAQQYEYVRSFAKQALQSSEPISEENKDHMERLANGVMPEHVYSKQHSRWEIRDALTNEVKNRNAVQAFKEEQKTK